MTRRDPTTVEERLRAALNVELAQIREGIDMSARAVSDRLREACELSTLCLALGERRD